MSDLVPALRDAPKLFPETLPTEASVRYGIAERTRNGWAEHLIVAKIRGKWYFCPANYERWLKAQLSAA